MATSTLAAALLAAGDAPVASSVKPWVFGVVFFVIFMVLLGVTWAFRSIGNKH